jgi:hypothetical protein
MNEEQEPVDPLDDIITKSANHLGEHFDAVLILASSLDGDGTLAYCRRRGNGFAIVGMANDFLIKDHEKIRILTRQQMSDDTGDDAAPPPHQD